ncbi:MAG: DNA cytosine methyltransferase [Erysipelotrichaceae bacterium]
MNDLSNFRLWLTENKKYSKKTIGNHVSRFKRANNILTWFNDPIYQFKLEQSEEYQSLTGTVPSQIKKAVKLYSEFVNMQEAPVINEKKGDMNILSLFANIGVAEAYLKEIGFNVVVANELIERRAILYSKIYPETHMICGDITNKKTFENIVKESKDRGVNIIMATPPCQGMSTVGQMLADDVRNRLVCQVIEAIKEISPKYVMIENVPSFFSTEIVVGEEKILIPELLIREVGKDYHIHKAVIDTKDYSVPQTRERAIVLMTRKDQKVEWTAPKKEDTIITMRDAIGNLPKLDPFITDVDEEELLAIVPHYHERAKQAETISKWHIPPHHIKRQVVAMQHTPSGQTAFDNDVYYPVKADGKTVKGFRNTYKRQNWDSPAYTVTMDNRKISSQNNVHPGLKEYVDENGDNIYSDARALTLYELMKIMSIPDNWPVPDDTSEAFLRRIIGEGIPPLFVKKVFEKLKQEK